MTSIAFPTLRYALATIGAATLLAGCADRAPVAPRRQAAGAPSLALSAPELAAAADPRFPELGSCQQNLQVPEGSRVTFHVYATGVQIYRWNGASWGFVAPAADLFADAGGNGLVGTHFAGPTWLTVSGSRVVGTVATNRRCTPDPTAIAWLKLDAAASGSGVFEQTTLIQRVNTAGGLAPAAAGSYVGEEARVPYTAEYYFYRAP